MAGKSLHQWLLLQHLLFPVAFSRTFTLSLLRVKSAAVRDMIISKGRLNVFKGPRTNSALWALYWFLGAFLRAVLVGAGLPRMDCYMLKSRRFVGIADAGFEDAADGIAEFPDTTSLAHKQKVSGVGETMEEKQESTSQSNLFSSKDDDFLLLGGSDLSGKMVSSESRTVRSGKSGTGKVPRLGSVLGSAGMVGFGKAVEILDTLGYLVTTLSPDGGFISRAKTKGCKISILAFEVANTILKEGTSDPAMASSLLCPDELPLMNVETILHMKGGLGETSYAQNSSLQKRAMDTLKSLITNSATDVYISQMPERFTVADLGCSSGPNALCLVEDIVRSVGKICGRSSQPPPEFSVLLNDLPTNDFNTVFFSLPEFTDRLKAAAKSDEWGQPMVFLSGVPGSFYGRLFLRKSVHFMCSCSSLHWLSQVPPGLFDETNVPINKGKMYISSTSPLAVPVAYLRQFQRDFSLFLKSRAAEIVPGGRMVLAMFGRQTEGYIDRRTTFLWELLSESLASLVSQGLVEQDKVDTYNVPFYAPSIEEIKEDVRREGSFSLDYVQTCEINLSSSGDAKEDGRTVSMAIRAIQESMLSHHFRPDIVDALFHKYTELVTESLEREEVKSVQIGVVLTRL